MFDKLKDKTLLQLLDGDHVAGGDAGRARSSRRCSGGHAGRRTGDARLFGSSHRSRRFAAWLTTGRRRRLAVDGRPHRVADARPARGAPPRQRPRRSHRCDDRLAPTVTEPSGWSVLVMEKMPYQVDLDTVAVHGRRSRRFGQLRLAAAVCRRCGAGQVVLRELRASDAASLFALLTTEEVARFISPPPTTVEGFERFIDWTHAPARGRHLCLLRGDASPASTPRSASSRSAALEPELGTAEWGFAIGSDVLGHRRVQGRRGAGARLRVRHDRRAPARSARRGEERPRQRRAAEDRRRAGVPAAQVVPQERRDSRPGRSTRFSRSDRRRAPTSASGSRSSSTDRSRALRPRDPSGPASAPAFLFHVGYNSRLQTV